MNLSSASAVILINFSTLGPFSGFYRGISPGVTGSFATGATYFGVIESTKTWLENANPNLSGHWSHFIAGGIGEQLFSYVSCILLSENIYDAT